MAEVERVIPLMVTQAARGDQLDALEPAWEAFRTLDRLTADPDVRKALVVEQAIIAAAGPKKCDRIEWHESHVYVSDGREVSCPGRYCTAGCTGPHHVEHCDLAGTERYTR